MTRKPIFTFPPNTLKLKVGDGGISAHIIKMCQSYLESNPVDFTPYAENHLKAIIDFQNDIASTSAERHLSLPGIINHIMQLKSNGGMFHYQLLSMVSDVMLRFLEKVETADEDLKDILAVYTKVITIILNKKLHGDGGAEGHALTQELQNACVRYNKKYNIT